MAERMRLDQKENRIHAAVRSCKGAKQHHNEDSYFFNGIYPGLAQMDLSSACREDFAPGGLLFAVSDGIENGQSGALASYSAMCGLSRLQNDLADQSFEKALIPWMQAMNRQIGEASSMGSCTLAMMYIQKDWLCMANIGDSRIYRYHDGHLVCMTHDHTKMQMLLDVQLLTPAQVKVHPQRDLVTRYLGMDHDLSEEKCRSCVCRPMPLIDRDRYLICTDGVTDMLDDERLGTMLSCADSADDCADRILQALRQEGCGDDATLIVLEVSMPDSEPTQEPDWQAQQRAAAPASVPVPAPSDGSESEEPISIVQTHTFALPGGEPLTIRTEVIGSAKALSMYQGMSIELKPHLKTE